MSVFPRRTIPGKSVMIHLCLNVAPQGNFPVTPFLKVAIRDPLGHMTRLFDGHVVLFPPEDTPAQNGAEHGSSRETPAVPWMGLDRGLSETASICGTEAGETLERLHTGQHYYFPFRISDDAMAGRYTLVSEMQLGGKRLFSLTQDQDMFWVEVLRLNGIRQSEEGQWARVENPSSEPVPAVLVRCPGQDRDVSIQREYVTMPAQQVTELAVGHDKCFLVFNEGREVIFLAAQTSLPCVIRNQAIVSVRGRGASDHLTLAVPHDGDTAFELTGMRRTLWEKAAQCPTRGELLRDVPVKVYEAMLEQGLICELPGTQS